MKSTDIDAGNPKKFEAHLFIVHGLMVVFMIAMVLHQVRECLTKAQSHISEEAPCDASL